MLKRLRRIAIVVVILYGAYFFYLGPRLTGDAFVSALQRADGDAIGAIACQDSGITNLLSRGVTGLLSGLNVQIDWEVRRVAYTPLANEYTFEFVPADDGIIEISPGFRLLLRPTGPLTFCVHDMGTVG
ncbi:MAG: hypothetical protein GYB67_00640 [Chloroflexi bacterium]|nr:hypothetical protein [Chloroflexota bacterium]